MSNPRHSIRLLVNADDFGLHADINRGISECVERGRVQSVSFSATGQAIEWKKLQEWGREGVLIGLHVTLVGEPWATDGRILRGWKDLAGRLLFEGGSIRENVNREIRSQFQLCADNGLDPHTLSHVDSHQHVHVLSGVWQSCVELSHEYGIPRIRLPWCPSWRAIKRSVGGVALQVISWRRAAQWKGSLPCLGLAHTGRNTVATFSHELSCAARAADVPGHPAMELVVHPGVNTPGLEAKYADWRFNWTAEREALLSPQFVEAVEAVGYTFSDRIEASQPNHNSVSD